ncbi:MAG: hypothetical protein ICV56_04145 [Nitrososphaeraceae archaeon]|nr:hypothetical protein [Nitrososphaeraceae archaeon]
MISVTYLNFTPLSLAAANLSFLMDSTSMITDGALESTTESIFCFALDTNPTSALVEF